jgi:thiosulfate/3-mercaptopyruvate sulfurtransferase
MTLLSIANTDKQNKHIRALMKLVINPKSLNSLLGDKNKRKKMVIVDVRTFADYMHGHVPGAINVDLMQFHWIDTSSAGITQFNKQTRILFSNLGLTKNTRVIFYENNTGPTAARGVWLLSYFSHRNVCLLDGGFARWQKEGYPVETKTNPYRHSVFRGTANPKILATYEKILTAIKNKDNNVLIIDTRSSAEFDGSILRAAKVGHIPGATNIEWSKNIAEGGAFKDTRKLREVYSRIPKDKEIITYCQGGYRAANTYLALKMIGYRNIKVYLGSWGEWGNKEGLPAEK